MKTKNTKKVIVIGQRLFLALLFTLAIAKVLLTIHAANNPVTITVVKSAVIVEAGSPQPNNWITLFGISVFDDVDGDITQNMICYPSVNTINMKVPATHTIYCEVLGSDDSYHSIEFDFVIRDTTPPPIEASKSSVIIKTAGTLANSWTELFGISAHDIVDGNVTGNIDYSIDINSINTDIATTYTIIATVRDQAGNVSKREFTLTILEAEPKEPTPTETISPTKTPTEAPTPTMIPSEAPTMTPTPTVTFASTETPSPTEGTELTSSPLDKTDGSGKITSSSPNTRDENTLLVLCGGLIFSAIIFLIAIFKNEL